MKIKELNTNYLSGVKFRHPATGEVCIWASSWDDGPGKAGVWFYDETANVNVRPIFLTNIQEAYEFDLV